MEGVHHNLTLHDTCNAPSVGRHDVLCQQLPRHPGSPGTTLETTTSDTTTALKVCGRNTALGAVFSTSWNAAGAPPEAPWNVTLVDTSTPPEADGVTARMTIAASAGAVAFCRQHVTRLNFKPSQALELRSELAGEICGMSPAYFTVKSQAADAA